MSVSEGWSPTWAPDGRTIYFRNQSGFMAVAADLSGERLELGSPRPIADVIAARGEGPEPELNYTPVLGDKGFIVVAEGEKPRGFTVITNVGSMLRDRARAAGPPP